MSVETVETHRSKRKEPRTRRTQKQRSAASRQMVLDAARKTLITHGYAGASTWEICRTGEFSKGQLLHHFRTKNDLFLAIIDDLAAASLSSYEAALQAAPVDHQIEVFLDWLWSTLEGDFFTLGLEILTAARTAPSLGKQVRLGADELRKMLDERIDTIVKSVGVSNEEYLRATLQTSVMLVRGIGLDLAVGGPRDIHRAKFNEWRETVLAIC